MNIIFFGSGVFAVKSLEALVESGHKISLVVTQPDKPKGRHLVLSPTEVKVRANQLGFSVYQPEGPHSSQALVRFKQAKPDLFVVISYGHILNKKVLGIPGLYPLNVHASLLPKYRGAAPINWAIVNGEKETGVTVIKMNEKMDKGDILLQKSIKIDEQDNAVTLEEKLSLLAALTIVEGVSLIEQKKARFIRQVDKDATIAPKLKKEDGKINWQDDCVDIYNRVRGFAPWPSAFTCFKGALLKIHRAVVNKETGRAGEIIKVSKDAITVGCGNGSLDIIELQLANEKKMAVEAFICGHKVKVGDLLG